MNSRQHEVLVEQFTDLNDRMAKMNVTIDKERATREDEIRQVNKRFDEQKKDLQELVQEEVAKA